MATHSSILAWRVPSTEEHGGLQAMGCQSRTTLEHKHRIHILKSKSQLAALLG